MITFFVRLKNRDSPLFLPESCCVQRGGNRNKRFSAGITLHVQKRFERAHLLVFWPSGQLEPNWMGAVACTNICAYWRLRVRTPPCACIDFFFFFWCFGAQDAACTNRWVVRGCTGKRYEVRGWPCFAIFCDFCFANLMAFGCPRPRFTPTRLKPHKMSVFDTDPLPCVFGRIFNVTLLWP